MKKVEKQRAVVNKIHEMVRNRKNYQLPENTVGLSVEIANKVQDTSHSLNVGDKVATITPAYLKLAEQMYLDDAQIFCAAAYTLTNYVKNRPFLKDKALEFFYKRLLANKANEDMYSYLNKKILELESL